MAMIVFIHLGTADCGRRWTSWEVETLNLLDLPDPVVQDFYP